MTNGDLLAGNLLPQQHFRMLVGFLNSLNFFFPSEYASGARFCRRRR